VTTNKIVIIVGAVVITLALLMVIFVGVIVAFALYSVGNSQAAMAAKDFLRKNERLKQDIGEVNGFGKFVTGSINVHNSDGDATLSLKVIGEQRTVNCSVDLIYRAGRPWRVTAASCRNENGQTIELFNAYESERLIPLLVA
jgi:hypothetical protein